VSFDLRSGGGGRRPGVRGLKRRPGNRRRPRCKLACICRKRFAQGNGRSIRIPVGFRQIGALHLDLEGDRFVRRAHWEALRILFGHRLGGPFVGEGHQVVGQLSSGPLQLGAEGRDRRGLGRGLGLGPGLIFGGRRQPTLDLLRQRRRQGVGHPTFGLFDGFTRIDQLWSSQELGGRGAVGLFEERPLKSLGVLRLDRTHLNRRKKSQVRGFDRSRVPEESHASSRVG
jgi:hypothetical protein